jgi:hypothetical protein
MVQTLPAVLRLSSTRTRADVVGCIASVVGASALIILLFLPEVPVTGPRFYIISFISPVTRIIGYWVLYNRLRDAKPIWAELGFYPLVLGSLFHVVESALRASANLTFSTLTYSANDALDFILKSLVAVTLPFGLTIYAWLLATSPLLRRWLGLSWRPRWYFC